MFEFRFFEIWREPEYIERLVTGVATSFWLTVVSSIIGFLLALVLAVSRRSRVGVFSWPAATYVEVVRNTPLIIQLFFVAFGLPLLFDYRWPFEWSALLALSLNFSAYYCEIIRAGLDNLDDGQYESAAALGLTKAQSFFLVVLPQSLCHVYPSLVSQFVFLFLTTGIISEIGIEELTWSGRFIADRTFRDFEVYLLLTLLYVLLALFFRLFFYGLGSQAFRWQKLENTRS